MTIRFLSRLGGLALLPLMLVACDSDPSSSETEEIVFERVSDLPADPITGLSGGRPVGDNVFTFYSLRENRVVAQDDSASTDWDIALKATTILVNGGSSGPGNGAAIVEEGIFEEVSEAPATGWAVDSAQNGPAITPGSGAGWYNYNPATMIVSPIPGRVLHIRTADGRYAKVRIVSYYQGAPATPTAESTARHYTFDYVFQPDGSRSFE